MVNREKLAFAPICYIFAICSRSIYEHALRSPTQLIRKQPTLRDHAERLGVPGAKRAARLRRALFGSRFPGSGVSWKVNGQVEKTGVVCIES